VEADPANKTGCESYPEDRQANLAAKPVIAPGVAAAETTQVCRRLDAEFTCRDSGGQKRVKETNEPEPGVHAM